MLWNERPSQLSYRHLLATEHIPQTTTVQISFYEKVHTDDKTM